MFSGIVGAIAIVLAFVGSNSLPLNVGSLVLILIGSACSVSSCS